MLGSPGWENQEAFHPLGETERCWKPRPPLKGPVHGLTHLQASSLGCSRGAPAQEVPGTRRET